MQARVSQRVLDFFRRGANFSIAALLGAAVIPLVIGGALIAAKGPFSPLFHDEYAHIFAAETFCAGRLTNPAHPYWRHFENFDLLSQPTFMSRKPPANGLILCLGKKLFGSFAAGTLLAVALAVAAIGWACMAWLSPGWACIAAILAGLHPTMISWSVDFWGGGIAACAGALTLGAWKRLLERPSRRLGAVFALGLILLANSRPFEGLVLAIVLGPSLLKRLSQMRIWIGPAALIAVAALFAMCYDNSRVTGNALLFPYTAYEKTYSSTPILLWQKGSAPRTDLPGDLDYFFNRFNHSQVQGQDAWPGYARMLGDKAVALFYAWLEPAPYLFLFTCGLLGGAPISAALTLLAFILGIMGLTYGSLLAHYSAPGAALFFVVVTAALSRLDGFEWRGYRFGRAVTALTLILCAVGAWTACVRTPLGASNACARIKGEFLSHATQTFGGASRHLVFVHNSAPANFIHQGWLYNEPDLGRARVIWARDLTRASNCQLSLYEKDRTLWRANTAESPIRFELVWTPSRFETANSNPFCFARTRSKLGQQEKNR